MIGRLNGSIIEKHPPFLLLDVHGVGYELQTSMNTFYHLPEEGENVVLYTHLVVREDAQILYGFYDQRERTLFRMLIKVNGVGPKIALAILSSMSADAFVVSVNQQDVSGLIRIPGVGRKTAERLIVEMRDRLADWVHRSSENSQQTGDSSVLEQTDIVQDAISALIALGYKPPEASRMVSRVVEVCHSSKELIRKALKEPAKG